MATITASPTLSQIEGITRKNLFKTLLMSTGLGMYGTATSGSTTLIGDTGRLKSTQYDNKDWVGGWARISSDSAGAAAAPEAESSPITTYAPTHATDHITMNPALTAGVASGDGYELWRNFNPKDAIDILDSVLTDDVYMPCWTMLTEVPDGDMEQTSASDDWTAVNSTVTKQTTEPVMFGKRKLRVVATAANGYAKNASVIPVEPGSKYHISAIARASAASTTATLQLYDETNSASIDSKSSTYLFPNRIHFEVTIPSTCYSVTTRLITVEDTKTTEWDEVCFYPTDSSDIRLPWWVKGRNQILGFFQSNPDEIANDIWDWNLKGEQDRRWFVQDRFQGQLRAQARQGVIGGNPIFILGLRNETAYSNDNTDKKYIDNNLLVSALAFRIYSRLAAQSIPTNNKQKYQEIRDENYRKWKHYESQQMEDLARILSVADGPLVYLNDGFARYRY